MTPRSPPSSTSRPTPSPTSSPTRPRLRGDRQRARLRRRRGRTAPRRDDRAASAAGSPVDPRDPRACRPPVGRALPARHARRPDRIGARITTVQHTFAEIYNAERGFAPRRVAVRPPVRGRRAVRDRRAGGRVPGDAGPHAGLRLATGSATTSSSATRCSCPTTARRAATSPAATRAPCTARSAASSTTTRRRCSGSATTTRRRAATSTPGAPRSAPSASRTRRSATASARTSIVALREAKDRTLGTPKLLIPSIQVNMRAGHLPPAEDNGVSYLKVPVNVIGRPRD